MLLVVMLCLTHKIPDRLGRFLWRLNLVQQCTPMVQQVAFLCIAMVQKWCELGTVSAYAARVVLIL